MIDEAGRPERPRIVPSRNLAVIWIPHGHRRSNILRRRGSRRRRAGPKAFGLRAEPHHGDDEGEPRRCRRLSDRLRASTKRAALSPAEQQAVLLAVSSYNDCHYCTKAHAAAGQQAGLNTETTATINEGGLPNDDRLCPLVQATRRILGKRGWLSDVDESEFEDLGLGRPEFYEIIALVGIKTMSNYVNHIAETKLDEPFRQ